MEDGGLQYGVYIDVMLPTSTLHQYENMVCNNDYHYPLINGNIPT